MADGVPAVDPNAGAVEADPKAEDAPKGEAALPKAEEGVAAWPNAGAGVVPEAGWTPKSPPPLPKAGADPGVAEAPKPEKGFAAPKALPEEPNAGWLAAPKAGAAEPKGEGPEDAMPGDCCCALSHLRDDHEGWKFKQPLVQGRHSVYYRDGLGLSSER